MFESADPSVTFHVPNGADAADNIGSKNVIRSRSAPPRIQAGSVPARVSKRGGWSWAELLKKYCTAYGHASQIIPLEWQADQKQPLMWVGDWVSALDTEFLNQEQISVVINCTTEHKFVESGMDAPILRKIYKYRIPVDDDLTPGESVAMVQAFKWALPLIHFHRSRGRRILIHCHAGIQRSAIVALAYLYEYCVADVDQAFAILKNARPEVFTPSMNFIDSFCLYFGELASTRERFVSEAYWGEGGLRLLCDLLQRSVASFRLHQ